MFHFLGNIFLQSGHLTAPLGNNQQLVKLSLELLSENSLFGRRVAATFLRGQFSSRWRGLDALAEHFLRCVVIEQHLQLGH